MDAIVEFAFERIRDRIEALEARVRALEDGKLYASPESEDE